MYDNKDVKWKELQQSVIDGYDDKWNHMQVVNNALWFHMLCYAIKGYKSRKQNSF